MSSEYWIVGLVGSSITAVTFLAVSALLGNALQRGKQWKKNPLAVATMLIFLTCGIGHLIHSLQMVLPAFGQSAIGTAARIHYGEWHMWLADAGTAIAGTWYLVSRRAFPNLVSGAAMYENARRQQRRAVEIHDNIVQSLAKAKWNLDLGDTPGSKEALAAAVAKSKSMHEQMEQPV